MTLRTKRERIIAARHYAALFGDEPIEPLPPQRTRRPADPLQPTEHQIQSATCAWWRLSCKGFGLPEFALAAWPNGGARDVVTGARLKAEGVRRGMPDLFLFAKRGDYGGLAIELKKRGGRVTDDQDEVHGFLDAAGYQVIIAWSVEEARDAITKYLRNVA